MCIVGQIRRWCKIALLNVSINDVFQSYNLKKPSRSRIQVYVVIPPPFFLNNYY